MAATSGISRKRSAPKKSGIFPSEDRRRVLALDIGIRNLSSAIVTCSNEVQDFAIEHLALIDIVKYAGSQVTDSRKIPVRILVDYTLNYLWDHVELFLRNELHAIVVEVQAQYGNKYKAIGTAVQTFFTVYYRVHNRPVPPILHQSGSQKLKIYMNVPGLDLPVHTPNKTAYRFPAGKARKKKMSPEERKEQQRLARIEYTQNKEYARAHFAAFLDVYPRCHKWKPMWAQLEKQDDVADAAFHAIFVLCIGSTRLPRNHSGQVILPITTNNNNNNAAKSLSKNKTATIPTTPALINEIYDYSSEEDSYENSDSESENEECIEISSEEEESVDSSDDSYQPVQKRHKSTK